jgi:hypothetical protein
MTRLAAIAVVVAACAHPAPAQPQRPMRTFLAAAAELDTIRAATLRYLFARSHTSVFCVELTPSDARPSFLARFSTERVPVKPGSACAFARDGLVRDTATGQPATAFRISEVTWDDDTGTANVTASATEGNRGGGGASYQLRLSAGAWRVVSHKVMWESRASQMPARRHHGVRHQQASDDRDRDDEHREHGVDAAERVAIDQDRRHPA